MTLSQDIYPTEEVRERFLDRLQKVAESAFDDVCEASGAGQWGRSATLMARMLTRLHVTAAPFLEDAFRAGREEGSQDASGATISPPGCQCDGWLLARSVGLVRQTSRGFVLAWRLGLGPPVKTRFNFCPWCGACVLARELEAESSVRSWGLSAAESNPAEPPRVMDEPEPESDVRWGHDPTGPLGCGQCWVGSGEFHKLSCPVLDEPVALYEETAEEAIEAMDEPMDEPTVGWEGRPSDPDPEPEPVEEDDDPGEWARGPRGAGC